MCGIAGLVLRPPGRLDGALADRILSLLEHRGPDDRGWLALGRDGASSGREPPATLEADVVLLHRRLSILDLSEAGRQPMTSADGRYAIVLNGEIYNFLELRAELEALGHRFRTGTDTEVLLAAYAEWGAAALTRLVGMFALAILDTRERRLFLARDPFGIKPLYYARWRDGFAFASEIGPLLELPGVSRAADARSVYDYVRFGPTDHGERTFFADVSALRAAHFLELELDRPEAAPRRYWRIDLGERLDMSLDEAAGRLRELFIESVRLHLRSDVPVGAFLSGGIDSSAIVGAMRALGGKAADLPTFSYVAEEPRLSEERWIDLMAAAAGVRGHKVQPASGDLPEGLPRLVAVQEEPFDGLLVYAQHRVFELARQAGLKVVLNGQGADELLGGYSVFLTARLASLVRRGRWLEAARFARQAARLPVGGGLTSLLRAEGLLLPPRVRRVARRAARDTLVPSWLDAGWLRERGVVPAAPAQAEGEEALREKLHLLLTETKLPQLLRREDRNSMAFSIECRVPFLTPALAGFLLALPEDYLIAPDGTTKAVFRRAMRGLVPDEVLGRRDKIGFQTPEHRWLLEQRAWVDSVLSSPAAERVAPLRLDRVRAAWEQADAPGRDTRIWRWLNLILWSDRFGVSF